MKITKTRLKEIIREELSTVRENEPPEAGMPAWEGEPFGEYDLEAENEKGRLAAAKALGVDPEDPSLWQKILAAVEKANLFPRAEQ
tara:strand:- start:653 stop:910 length:258 start_codon:yes stop_codon:yes gene_type:complete